jgi:hypothetical protein|tara:strand:+ start:282 stop:422 length:141 start_codon:yes stop_codon:yes gene_type:complete
MNKEKETFEEAQKNANEEVEYNGGKAYYKFLEMFYKAKKEEDENNT